MMNMTNNEDTVSWPIPDTTMEMVDGKMVDIYSKFVEPEED
jgi:hypothetical protein